MNNVFFLLQTEEVSEALQKVYEWKFSLLSLWPNILAAIFMFVVYYLIGLFGKRLINRYIVKFTNNKAATNVIGIAFFLLFFFIGLMTALSLLGLSKAVTTFLAGAGIIGLALGFALQETAGNFLSGIFMSFKSNFKEGDFIKTNDMQGTVERIDLRSTKIKTVDGYHVTIPNKAIFQQPMVNYNQYSTRRIELTCGVSYNSDLDHVEQVTLDVLKNIEDINSSPQPKLYFTDFGDSAINYSLLFWVNFLTAQDYFETQHDVIKAIKKTYEREGIDIPFPIRTVIKTN